MYILIAILMFSFLIFIHEFGHFITAKLFNVKVNEFSIFMGPALLKWGKGETQYSLRLFPVGGYCAMEGEDGSSKDPRSFTAKSLWKRIIILAAGATMNFITGLAILLVIFSFSDATRTLEITEFVDGCALYSTDGFQPHDIIKEIDGNRLYIFNDFSMITERVGEGFMDVVVERNGKRITLNVDMTKQDYTDNGETRHIYGIVFGEYEELTFTSSIRNSWYTAIDFVRMVRFGLIDLFSGRASVSEMSGPVGIVDTIQETGKSSDNLYDGLLNVLYLCAFIAVNLSFMNLLPIPALDGGHIFLLFVSFIIEGITKKHIDPKYEAYIHMVGLFLLLALMAFVTFQDILKLL